MPRASRSSPPACGRTGSRPPRRPRLDADRRAGRSRRTRPASRRMNSGVNATTSVVGDACVGEQLEPSLERRDQVDPVAERDPRVRVERDHGRVEPRVDRRLEHGAVPAVDAVERSDRDGARPALELGRGVRDPHRPAASLARASSSGITAAARPPRRRGTARPPCAGAPRSGRRARRRSTGRRSPSPRGGRGARRPSS